MRHVWVLFLVSSLAAHAAGQTSSSSADEELMAAVRKGDVSATKALLDRGANVNAVERYGVTPLITAALRGNLPMVKLLVERGADLDVKDTFYNATALQMATGGNAANLDVVEYLVSKGAGPAGDALTAGIEADRPSLVRAALAGGKVSKHALSGALLSAQRAKKNAIVSLLRSAGAEPPETRPAEILEKYVGAWRGDDGFEVTFAIDAGLLTAAVSGSEQPIALTAVDDTTFRAAEFDGLQVQFTVADGAASSAVWERGPRQRPLTRVTR